jgi:hypothetical protein
MAYSVTKAAGERLQDTHGSTAMKLNSHRTTSHEVSRTNAGTKGPRQFSLTWPIAHGLGWLPNNPMNVNRQT